MDEMETKKRTYDVWNNLHKVLSRLECVVRDSDAQIDGLDKQVSWDSVRLGELNDRIDKLTARVEKLEESWTPESILAHTPPVGSISNCTGEVADLELAAELYAIRHDCDASEFRELQNGAEAVYLETARNLLEKFQILTKEEKP